MIQKSELPDLRLDIMGVIQDLAEFRSSRFAPVLPEECQVNPGRYGAELAFWICTRLYEEDRIATSYPDYEDWGWLLSYSTKEGDEFAVKELDWRYGTQTA